MKYMFCFLGGGGWGHYQWPILCKDPPTIMPNQRCAMCALCTHHAKFLYGLLRQILVALAFHTYNMIVCTLNTL